MQVEQIVTYGILGLCLVYIAYKWSTGMSLQGEQDQLVVLKQIRDTLAVMSRTLLDIDVVLRKTNNPTFLIHLYSGGKRMVKMQLKDSQVVTCSAVIEDAKGVPVPGATLDAVPVYTLDDASFGDLVASADGLSATFTPNGKQGICHIQFSAAFGGNAFAGVSEDIVVIPGDAAQVVLTLGTPV